jgi:aminopeptidase N
VKNLTRDQARQRAGLLDVASYDIALDLTATDGERFGSVTEVRFSCRTPGASTFVELDGEALEVELNGRALPAGEGNRIPLPDLAADNVLRVRARCATSRSGEGLHRFVDPADDRVYLYAQSFLDDAQRVFACFDQPDLKATFHLTVDAPADWTVVANERGRRDGNRWTFARTARLSTYLFTVAAGPWHGVQRWHGDVELGAWCRQSLSEHLEADELFEVTAQALDLQQDLFGRRYPFGDTYDQLFVPEFNAGAMENPGAVTFSEDLLFRSRVTEGRRRTRAMVIAHELSHMWFGDLVTMRWWDDLWLNESFAELMGYLTVDRATRFEDTWVDFCTTRKAWGYRADALPTTHPVAGTARDTRSALLDFDGISYAKGASVLRQLMATIGEDAFFAGVRDHFDRHAFGNAVLADLLASFERASSRGLQDWARGWLKTPGTSTLRVVGDGLRQEPPADHPVHREHRIGVGLYRLDRDALVLEERLDVTSHAADVPLPGSARADVVLPNDDDRTFAKVRVDERSLAALTGHLSGLADPLARAVAWAALWDATRDGELPAHSFVGAVLDHAPAERDPSVVETLLLQARTAAVLYSNDAAGLRDRLAAASHDAAVSGDPGSDLQLVHLRSFAAAAGPDRLPALQAVLDGRDAPRGLAVDTDLRWLLVQRLAALGALDDAALDAEGERDRTAAGRLALLTARAARPVAAAKQESFTRAVEDDALSSHEAQALAAGLWQPLQDDVCRLLVPGYVDAVPRLWAEQPGRGPGAHPAAVPLDAAGGRCARRGRPAAGAGPTGRRAPSGRRAAARPRAGGAGAGRGMTHGTPSASQTASAHWR